MDALKSLKILILRLVTHLSLTLVHRNREWNKIGLTQMEVWNNILLLFILTWNLKLLVTQHRELILLLNPNNNHPPALFFVPITTSHKIWWQKNHSIWRTYVISFFFFGKRRRYVYSMVGLLDFYASQVCIFNASQISAWGWPIIKNINGCF